MATEIKSASVARGVDKITHETYYVVKSDDSRNTWHEVRWNNELLAWQCDGEKCVYQHGGMACKHARSVLEDLKIRRARIALEMGGEAPQTVARLQAEEDRKLEAQVERRYTAPLNGNREFSLLK